MHRSAALLLLCALAPGTGACNPNAEASAPQKISYPDEGVELGAGWDGLEGRKTSGSCIAFSKSPRVPPQESATQIRRVVDHYTFNEAIDLSAEMEMQGFLDFGGSAKARYSRQTTVAADRTSFVLSAWVANEAESIEARPGESEIYLLPELVPLLKNNPQAFRARCGDHFVTSMWTGAELFGFISFQSDDETERQSLGTELEASGFGFSGGGSFSQALNRHKSKVQWTLTAFQSGGSGEPTPMSEEEFLRAASRLRESAARAPRRLAIAIRPYDGIKGWPANEPFPEPPSDYDALVARLAEEVKVYDDLAAVLAAPDKYAIGYPKSLQELRDWQDQAQLRIREFKRQLANCVQRKMRAECGHPPTDAELSASLLQAVDMPVPNKSVQDMYVGGGPACIPWNGPCKDEPPTLDRGYHPTAVANAIYRLRIEERARGYCAMDRAHPFCLANSVKKNWRDWIFQRLKLPAPGPLPITESTGRSSRSHVRVMPPVQAARAR